MLFTGFIISSLQCAGRPLAVAMIIFVGISQHGGFLFGQQKSETVE